MRALRVVGVTGDGVGRPRRSGPSRALHRARRRAAAGRRPGGPDPARPDRDRVGEPVAPTGDPGPHPRRRVGGPGRRGCGRPRPEDRALRLPGAAGAFPHGRARAGRTPAARRRPGHPHARRDRRAHVRPARPGLHRGRLGLLEGRRRQVGRRAVLAGRALGQRARTGRSSPARTAAPSRRSTSTPATSSRGCPRARCARSARSSTSGGTRSRSPTSRRRRRHARPSPARPAATRAGGSRPNSAGPARRRPPGPPVRPLRPPSPPNRSRARADTPEPVASEPAPIEEPADVEPAGPRSPPRPSRRNRPSRTRPGCEHRS